jgi:AcrR family transcriptional regulator
MIIDSGFVARNKVHMNGRSGARRSENGARRKPEQLPELPPELAPDGPRRRILEAALRLFATQGYHGSSVREIVRLVEMQASAVYAHFASKEHVLAELARAGHEAHFEALQKALLDAGSDPVDQLCAYVRANVAYHLRYSFVARVVSSEMHALKGELLAPALAFRRQAAALMLQIIERGVRSGAFVLVAGKGDGPRHESARDTTLAALGAMTLRLPYWFPSEAAHDPAEIMEDQVALALRIVGARGAR